MGKCCFFDCHEINERIKNDIDELFIDLPGVIYAYAILDKKKPTRMVIINNRPDWFSFYLDQKLQLVDPVVIKALQTVSGFSWDKTIKASGAFNFERVFNESAMYDINQGYTFVIHDYLNNLVLLSVITESVSGKDAINLREHIYAQFCFLHQKTLDYYSRTGTSDSRAFFSLRESEILSWVAAGKTYVETATILGVSPRTVKFHMSNVMKKLGVYNARHAVRLCMEFGILLPAE